MGPRQRHQRRPKRLLQTPRKANILQKRPPGRIYVEWSCPGGLALGLTRLVRDAPAHSYRRRIICQELFHQGCRRIILTSSQAIIGE